MSALLLDVGGPNLDRTMLGGRNLRREPAGLVDRAALEDVIAPERFLDLGVRAVRHERVAVPDADRRGRLRRLQLGAADDFVLGRELHVALVDGLPLVVAHRVPAVLVSVDQGQVLHRSPFYRAARSRINIASWAKTSSGGPKGSWWRSSSVSARCFAVSRSTRFLRMRFTVPPLVACTGTTNGRRLDRQHSPEKCERACLVEWLVQVSALGRLDAGRAAVVARAAFEHPRGVPGPALEDLEASLVDAHAAGMAVVDEDRRRSGLEVEVRREAADVPPVAHRPQREQ